MNNRKKIGLLPLTALVLGLLVACGTPAATSSAPSSLPVGEASVKGTIVDATMNTLTIEVEGQELAFGTAEADKTQAEGLLIGSTVEVFYTGEIDGTDTSGVTVTRVVQIAPPPDASSAAGSPAGTAESSVSGTITYSDGAELTIETAKGVSLTFNVVGADATKANGLVEGDEVTVYYTGNIQGEDTSGATVVRLSQTGETPDSAAEKSVSGTITYSDGAELTLRTAGGQELTFNVVGADANGANGLVEGDEVTVYYTGVIHADDTSDVTVTRLVQ